MQFLIPDQNVDQLVVSSTNYKTAEVIYPGRSKYGRLYMFSMKNKQNKYYLTFIIKPMTGVSNELAF